MHLAVAAAVASALAGSGCADRVAPTLKLPGPTPDSLAAPVALVPLPRADQPAPAVPPELLRPGARFTLADVVQIALANNPLTRASWHNARAAAAFAGARRSTYYPYIDISGGLTTSQTSSSDGRQGDPTAVGATALSLTYLLFDFGGRRATVEDAMWALVAADWGHNATIQNTVFTVQATYFQYLNTRAQLAAARAVLESAQRNLDAASGRHDAGLATIADVLQARTAASQAELAVQTLEGQVEVVRGSLATAMGLSPALPVDVGDLPGEVASDRVDPGIEALVRQALFQRPDLSAARALVERAARRIEVARSDGLPAVAVTGSLGPGLYWPGNVAGYQTNWSTRVLLTVPLFTGYARSYDLLRATEEFALACAQVDGIEQQAILQVWTSYYALQTATRRLATSKDLLASAEQSERVAFARYKEGIGTILDLLVAQSALAGARATEIQSRTDWFVALARLARDTGAAAPLDQGITVQPKSPRP
jgi:outer membrane protein TolC